MNQRKEIHKLFNIDKKSLREIMDITGHAFETVQKYAYMDNFNIELPLKQTRGGKLDPFKDLIDQWLEEDEKAPRKQHHSAERIYERLIELYPLDFNVSSRSIRTYVADKKKESKKHNKCFIPLEYEPGVAQADFGTVYFLENGIKEKGFLLNLSFPYSNAGFCQLFKSENQESFLQGLKNIFEFIGGVPASITFDNPSTLVVKVKEYGERELTDIFTNFELHYNFNGIFCNPASGHEKGSVETKVGYHRRKFFVPMPEIDNLEEFNKELLNKCLQDMNRNHYKKNKPISELFKEDLQALKKLPDNALNIFKLIRVKADKYGKVKYDKKLYSTAPEYAQRELWLKASAFSIEILDDENNFVQSHKRLYGKQKESMKWEPYLKVVAKRPTALAYTGFFKELPQTVQEYFRELAYQEKKASFNMLHKMIEETDKDTAFTAFSLALEEGLKDADSIWTTYYTLTNQPVIAKDLEIKDPKIPNIIPFNINMQKYDELMQPKGGDILCSKR